MISRLVTENITISLWEYCVDLTANTVGFPSLKKTVKHGLKRVGFASENHVPLINTFNNHEKVQLNAEYIVRLRPYHKHVFVNHCPINS